MEQAWTVDVILRGQEGWSEGQCRYETFAAAQEAKLAALALTEVVAARVVFVGEGQMPQEVK